MPFETEQQARERHAPCSSCGALWEDCDRMTLARCCDSCLNEYGGTHYRPEAFISRPST